MYNCNIGNTKIHRKGAHLFGKRSAEIRAENSEHGGYIV